MSALVNGWRRIANGFDRLLGYGIKACERCGRQFSARPEWRPEQMVPTGPTSARLAYCRRCGGAS